MAKCHDNRRRRKVRRLRVKYRQLARKLHRLNNFPPGYTVAVRNYGFALYASSIVMRNGQLSVPADSRIGGYGNDDLDIARAHAWKHYDRSRK